MLNFISGFLGTFAGVLCGMLLYTYPMRKSNQPAAVVIRKLLRFFVVVICTSAVVSLCLDGAAGIVGSLAASGAIYLLLVRKIAKSRS